jgi:hypothetical protein
MLARQETLMVDRMARPCRPIEFQTDNGFSIICLSDINNSIPATGLVHQFLVRDPDGFELEVTVEITGSLAEALAWRSRGRLSVDSSYWLSCAERHLAEYLWDNEDYPPDGKIIVDEPILDGVGIQKCNQGSRKQKSIVDRGQEKVVHLWKAVNKVGFTQRL